MLEYKRRIVVLLLASQKKAVITGGLGFIGSNLAIRLVSEGYYCLIIDSLNPKYGGNLVNIKNVVNDISVKVNISDIRDLHSLKILLKDARLIFNMAGQTSHMDSMTDPYTDLAINSHAQLSLLETCRELAPNAKIIFASTRQIYGKPEYLPVDEKHPLCPVDVNGINKLAGEGYHLLYSKVYNIKASVLRLTNTYGPRMRIKDARQTFLGVWIKKILSGEQFEVWGGDQLRDYTYIDDCVEAILLASRSREADDNIYNIGGKSKPVSLLKTADILVESAQEAGINVLSNPYKICSYPLERRKIDIGDYYSCGKKIQEQLGWKPKISLKEGFFRTLLFYKEFLEEYK